MEHKQIFRQIRCYLALSESPLASAVSQVAETEYTQLIVQNFNEVVT